MRACAVMRASGAISKAAGFRKPMCRCSLIRGEAYQFDWSQEQAAIGGQASRLKVAQMLLCYSRHALCACLSP